MQGDEAREARSHHGDDVDNNNRHVTTLRLVAYVLAQVDRGERPSQRLLSVARDFVAEQLERYR